MQAEQLEYERVSGDTLRTHIPIQVPPKQMLDL